MVIASESRPAAVKASARARVLSAISEHGPITAARLGQLLGLTPTGVRRHLDGFVEDGLIEEHEAGPAKRGRGRPARSYVVSEAGHRTLGTDYGRLAADALHYLAQAAGPQALEAFARKRAEELESRYATQIAKAGSSRTAKVAALVEALTADGFSATARAVGQAGSASPLTGIQVCQGHCPVQHVAAEFPQFCDAETEAFSRLLGVHVQRLATLAHGDHVCTTFIPTPAIPAKEGSI